VWLTRVFNKNGGGYTSFHMSFKLLDALGYDADQFIHSLFYEGIPKYWSTNEVVFDTIFKPVFLKLFLFHYQLNENVIYHEVLKANGDIIPATHRTGTYATLVNDDTIVAKHFFIPDLKCDEEIKNDKVTMINPYYQRYVDLIDKTKHHFLGHYYGQKELIDPKIKTKICGYRKIIQEQKQES